MQKKIHHFDIKSVLRSDKIMIKKHVLFIDGVPDNHSVKVAKVYKDGSFSIITTGSSNIFGNLDTAAFDKSFLLLDANLQQQINVKDIDAVFNQISDVDTHKTALNKMKIMRKQLDPNIKFFNLPVYIERTSRENIYLLLQGIDKVYVPKTVKFAPRSPNDIYKKIQSENFKLPVIFRQAGKHGGVSTVIIHHMNNYEDFYPFALDGREYYLTQYVDYKKDDIYKKIRLIVIDGEVYIRHALFNDDWIVHSTNSRKFMSKNTQYAKKEVKIFESFEQSFRPYLKEQIKQIYQRVGLDYFGIDCFIDENFNILIFEVNSSMNILIKPKDIPNELLLNQKTDKIKNTIERMIVKRLNL